MTTDITQLELSNGQWVLLGAWRLEQSSKLTFSVEDLIVTAWELSPKSKTALGLKGYLHKHPNANKVIITLSGQKGLEKQGYLNRVKECTYELTPKGRAVVADILNGSLTQGKKRGKGKKDLKKLKPPPPLPPKPVMEVHITDEQSAWLQQIVDSIAMRKYEDGLQAELQFPDACAFWGAHPNTTNGQFQELQTIFLNRLAEFQKLTERKDIQLQTGQVITAEELRHVANLHDCLEATFAKHLKVLKSRIGH